MKKKKTFYRIAHTSCAGRHKRNKKKKTTRHRLVDRGRSGRTVFDLKTTRTIVRNHISVRCAYSPRPSSPEDRCVTSSPVLDTHAHRGGGGPGASTRWMLRARRDLRRRPDDRFDDFADFTPAQLGHVTPTSAPPEVRRCVRHVRARRLEARSPLLLIRFL